MGIRSCQILYSSYSRLPNEKFLGLVYLLPCTDANNTPCTGTYVGETERTISSCFQEHTSTSTNTQGHYKSAMLKQARTHNHHFRKKDITILANEQEWVKKGIKEALYIRALSPSISTQASTLSPHTLTTSSNLHLALLLLPLPHILWARNSSTLHPDAKDDQKIRPPSPQHLQNLPNWNCSSTNICSCSYHTDHNESVKTAAQPNKLCHTPKGLPE